MGGVFICYRRDDTAGWAGRLHADIQAGLRGVDIFRDIEDIPPGVRFDEFIAQAVGSCEVLIALIGPQWLTARGGDGIRRLDQPNDFIRAEIATGLDRNIRVIPALVGGAKLPSEAELPESIRGLALRQAYELSDSRWSTDCRKLVADIRPLLRASTPIKWRWIAAAAATVILATAAYALWPDNEAGISTLDSSTPSAANALDSSPPSASGTLKSPSASGGGTPAAPDVPQPTAIVARLTESGIESATKDLNASVAATTIANSAATVSYVATGGGAAGAFHFAWPGGDCWDIYRGDKKLTYGCGSSRQALQAGRYTIKPSNSRVFVPFDIQVRDGATTTAP